MHHHCFNYYNVTVIFIYCNISIPRYVKVENTLLNIIYAIKTITKKMTGLYYTNEPLGSQKVVHNAEGRKGRLYMFFEVAVSSFTCHAFVLCSRLEYV